MDKHDENVTIIEAGVTRDGVIGTVPGFVFLSVALVTLQAFRNASGTVVEVATLNGSSKPMQTINLSTSSPTATVQLSLLVWGSGMGLKDGTVALQLSSDSRSVIATIETNVFSAGAQVGTVGGTYYLPT